MGEKLFIDWSSKLETNVYLDFTRANGDRMLALGQESLVTTHMGWGYYLVNPWQDRMDMRLGWMIQSGLIQQWKSQALTVLKRRVKRGSSPRAARAAREELWAEAGYEEASSEAMQLGDLAGVFVIVLLALGVAAIIFAAELMRWSGARRKIARRIVSDK